MTQPVILTPKLASQSSTIKAANLALIASVIVTITPNLVNIASRFWPDQSATLSDLAQIVYVVAGAFGIKAAGDVKTGRARIGDLVDDESVASKLQTPLDLPVPPPPNLQNLRGKK